MLAAISVMVIVTVMVSVSRSGYRDNTLLTNVAYEIAQSIRMAQFYAASGRNSVTSSLDFQRPFGVNFDPTNSPSQYFVYRDNVGTDWRYNPPNDTTLGTYKIGQGAKITSVCRASFSGGVCLSGCVSTGQTNILFRRPSLQACINDSSVRSFPTDTDSCIANTNFCRADITITSAGGKTKQVKVYTSGQISIE
jgi:hypothetical protein